jgi:hypothetical protein
VLFYEYDLHEASYFKSKCKFCEKIRLIINIWFEKKNTKSIINEWINNNCCIYHANMLDYFNIQSKTKHSYNLSLGKNHKRQWLWTHKNIVNFKVIIIQLLKIYIHIPPSFSIFKKVKTSNQTGLPKYLSDLFVTNHILIQTNYTSTIMYK